MSRYRKIDVRIWNDRKFRNLKSQAKLLFFMLLTHPNLTQLGCGRSSMGGLSDELGWGREEFNAAFMELRDSGMVLYDESGPLYWIKNFLRYNLPANPNVVISWNDIPDLLPECKLKTDILQSTVDLIAEKCGEKWVDAIPHSFREALSRSNVEHSQASGLEIGVKASFAAPSAVRPQMGLSPRRKNSETSLAAAKNSAGLSLASKKPPEKSANVSTMAVDQEDAATSEHESVIPGEPAISDSMIPVAHEVSYLSDFAEEFSAFEGLQKGFPESGAGAGAGAETKTQERDFSKKSVEGPVDEQETLSDFSTDYVAQEVRSDVFVNAHYEWDRARAEEIPFTLEPSETLFLADQEPQESFYQPENTAMTEVIHDKVSFTDNALTSKSSDGLFLENDLAPQSISSPSEPKKRASGKRTLIPEGFTVTESHRVWAQKKGIPDWALPLHLAHFSEYSKRNEKTYANWDAAFRNAVEGNWARLNLDELKAIEGPEGKQRITEVHEVFDFWASTLSKQEAIRSPERVTIIAKRLVDGYTVSDLKTAILGVLRSPYHLGDNASNTPYDDLKTIFRDATQVDKFIALGKKGPASESSRIKSAFGAAGQQTLENAQNWLRKQEALDAANVRGEAPPAISFLSA